MGIRNVFAKYIQWSQSNGLVETISVCDDETGNYLLMNVGWNNYQRCHGVFIHLRIMEGKIQVEWNGTEDIIEELIAQGIPQSAFVAAFRHPNVP